jgi:hypothetical protein
LLCRRELEAETLADNLSMKDLFAGPVSSFSRLRKVP